MVAIIEVKDLVKVYNGSIRAVDGISFEVAEGVLVRLRMDAVQHRIVRGERGALPVEHSCRRLASPGSPLKPILRPPRNHKPRKRSRRGLRRRPDDATQEHATT